MAIETKIKMNKFNIELIQAINDWQASGFGDNKKRIVDEILKHSQSVPEKYKTLPSPCYRRVDLTGKHNLQIGLKLSLPEAESSWSFDKEVAKTFKSGVPPKNYTGVIFKIMPADKHFKVILNFDALFSDKDFVETCEKYKHYISNYEEGIERFENSEKEIILVVEELKIEQIWAYGGFSSSKEELAKKYFGYKPNKDEKRFFENQLNTKGIKLGGRWVTGEAKNRTVKKHIEAAIFVNNKVNTK